MRNLALALALVSLPCLAGEEYLGAIVSAAGADTTNATTAAPFVIPFGTQLTLYCTAAANVCTDTSTTCTTLGGAYAGVPVAATTVFPTSTKRAVSSAATVTISSAPSAVVRIVGAAAVTCYVWKRDGNE